MRYIVVIILFLVACQKVDLKQKRELNHDTIKMFTDSAISNVLRGKLKPHFFASRKPPKAPTNVILLDFDGGVVSNTSWNYAGDIIYESSNLNEAEQIKLFDTVKFDYAQFPITVTTDETVYNSAPATHRIRLILTTTSAWYGSGAGGVSFTDSYSWGDNTPCWVFTALLGYQMKPIRDAASHEIGHTLSLRHQALYDINCNLIDTYNRGNAEVAPIMGVPYNASRGEWWIGPTPYGCTNIQDDIQVIQSKM